MNTGPGSWPYPYGTEVLACSQFGRSPGLLEPSSLLLAQLSLGAYRDCDWRCRLWGVSSLSHGSPSSQSHRTIPFSSALAGGLILLCFLASCFQWARNRDTLPEPIKASADLRILGYVFLFSAAWGLCGLLGAPTYALRPDIAQQLRSGSGAPSMAVTVLVCLVVGWVCFALAERKLYQSPR